MANFRAMKGEKMKYINDITEAIGNTPLLKLNKVGKGVGANVFVKLEHLNPSGSYKDRMALSMIEAAERGETWNGRKLEKGGTIVEASAGNTAPALALVAAVKGYKAKFYLYRYMFEGETNSRMLITQAYGPEVAISSEPEKYIQPDLLEKLREEEPDLLDVLAAKKDCAIAEDECEKVVWVDQIYNKYNNLGQEKMAAEIFEQLDGKIDAIGCSVGAGGSLYGLCSGLAKLGVRPELTFGVVPHGTENYLHFEGEEAGQGEFEHSQASVKIAEAMKLDKWLNEKSIIENMLADGYPDRFYRVTDEEAKIIADRLCQEEGIYCGMSSGANVAIALKIAKELGPGKNVVTTIVDRRDRYMSEAPNEVYSV
ncbi:MAG: PLP-dependent cysteine synthase family protein [Saccharofermentanales bacterium]|jgi:cysteine synthase